MSDRLATARMMSAAEQEIWERNEDREGWPVLLYREDIEAAVNAAINAQSASANAVGRPPLDPALGRNKRVQDRYDELQHEGRHGHYETMFRVVREEVERALATARG